MSSRKEENFDVDINKVGLQLPALMELESLSIALNDGIDNPIVDLNLNVERFLEILDPNHWVELFPPSTVEKYRDYEGRPLRGNTYEKRMETVFNRFLNPAAKEFARFITEELPCELLRDGEWSEMYQVLTSWSKYKHWFFYACDPFDSVKTLPIPPGNKRSTTR